MCPSGDDRLPTPDIRLDRDRAIARVQRQIARLERLDDTVRQRAWIRRGGRGLFGMGAGFATLVKLKVASSIAAKIGLAALIGFGFAFPLLTLALVLLAGLIVSVVSCEDPGSLDLSCDCWQRRGRRDRLRQMIDQRRKWLGEDRGPPPRLSPDRSRRR